MIKIEIMGLSSKEVSEDGAGLGWSQTLELTKPPAKRQPPQQSEQLNCPRCDSTNTKFCYYNNYNKSQPRHFCRNCKRHWTKGGTLRSVPVGGGRKNKRQKTSNSNSGGATAANRGSSFFQEQKQGQIQFPGEINFPAFNFPLPNSGAGDEMFPSSISSLPMNFPFSSSSSSSFDTNPSSISTTFQSPDNAYEAIEYEDPTITMAATQPPWKPPCTGSVAMDMTTNYWNWDEFDALVSTDLNIAWDYDSEIKLP